eukprot:gene6313-6962_t
MNFEFGSIKFAEYPDEEYCVKLSEAEEKKVSLWIENKKTKSQWVTELSEDIAKYGPVGPPLSALLHALQEAFSSLDQANKTSATTAATATATSVSSQSEGSATLSAAMNGCPKSMTLTLKVKFSPVWESSYCFKLLAKQVSRADVLEARLRDCEEQLQQQKKHFEEQLQQQKQHFEEQLQQQQKQLQQQKLINARLMNPRVISLTHWGSVTSDSEQGNPLPFTIQDIHNDGCCNLTFTQSGLYRGFYRTPNNGHGSTALYTVQKVAVGTTLTDVYCSETIEFIPDK